MKRAQQFARPRRSPLTISPPNKPHEADIPRPHKAPPREFCSRSSLTRIAVLPRPRGALTGSSHSSPGCSAPPFPQPGRCGRPLRPENARSYPLPRQPEGREASKPRESPAPRPIGTAAYLLLHLRRRRHRLPSPWQRRPSFPPHVIPFNQSQRGKECHVMGV